MSLFAFNHFIVEDAFDKDDELEVLIEREEEYYVWLPREEVVRLRDHLNKILGVAQ